jgi:hypothetical protein
MESNGHQNYQNWDILMGYYPRKDGSWVKANNGVYDIDDIIQGKFDPENLWLIIRMAEKREYKSIFEKIRDTEANDTISNANMGNESID